LPIIESFEKEREGIERQNNYQPKQVVDDEEDDLTEDDDDMM